MLVVEQMGRVQDLATLRSAVRPAVGGLEINKGQSGSGAPVFIPFNSAQPNFTPRSVGILWGAVPGASPPVTYLSPMNEISNALSHEWYW